MNDTCDCCEGTNQLTPKRILNRPGLESVAYRVGTHAAFLETMKARLSSMVLELPDVDDPMESIPAYPLRSLTTRAPYDASIALLDAWATVGDVLTFYQERIANEGFLRTATERRSILELARLVGYELRPGVASSVFLALELDQGHEVMIQPYEIKAQSAPGPGELPQTFENTEPLDARAAWNRLQPRLTQPQTIYSIAENNSSENVRLYVKGVDANLSPNDVVLITENSEPYRTYRVAEARPDPVNDRTLVIFQERQEPPLPELEAAVATAGSYLDEMPEGVADTEMGQRVIEHLQVLSGLAGKSGAASRRVMRERIAKITEERDVAIGEQYSRLAPWLTALVNEMTDNQTDGLEEDDQPTRDDDPLKNFWSRLTKPASVPPRNTFSLDRNLARLFTKSADTGLRLASAFDSRLGQSVPVALENVKTPAGEVIRAYAFRAMARPFGHNAPLRATVEEGKPTTYDEWKIDEPLGKADSTGGEGDVTDTPNLIARNNQPAPTHHTPKHLFLDAEYKISSDGWVVLEGPGISSQQILIDLSKNQATVVQQSLGAYGLSAKTTCLKLADDKQWLSDSSTFADVRGTVVYAESEELTLAQEPIENSICGGETELIALDAIYSGLQSGRWLVVSGERDDIEDENNNKVRGVQATELVMLAEVLQQTTAEDGEDALSGEPTHTYIKLAKPLSYCYRRDSVTIYGNVVKATHGETRRETLGSGNAAETFQSFALKQAPLTFVSAPTPSGLESTLRVYVNDMQWREANSLADLNKTDRKFITKTDDEGKTTVIFGNGAHGARRPTGFENIRAVYRNGMGRLGNVRAGQVSLLLSKPLGVKGVKNYLRASGGADRESRDTARKNAPLTVTALDRLVSIPDYADFARTFAGVGKSVAARFSDGRRELVHVTIAGADDIPIDETSDLYLNLLKALRDFGDPHQPVALQVRELKFLVLSANLRVISDYEWVPVVKAVRARLLDAFSFERRELGQDVLLSEVIAAIQSVRGVDYVDVDVFGSIPEKKTDTDREDRPIRRLLTPLEIAGEAKEFLDKSDLTKRPEPLVRVNLAGFEDGAMRPAQLAYLTPDVSDTVVLNQIK